MSLSVMRLAERRWHDARCFLSGNMVPGHTHLTVSGFRFPVSGFRFPGSGFRVTSYGLHVFRF